MQNIFVLKKLWQSTLICHNPCAIYTAIQKSILTAIELYNQTNILLSRRNTFAGLMIKEHIIYLLEIASEIIELRAPENHFQWPQEVHNVFPHRTNWVLVFLLQTILHYCNKSGTLFLLRILCLWILLRNWFVLRGLRCMLYMTYSVMDVIYCNVWDVL